MGTFVDLTNKKFGKLTALSKAGVSKQGKILWNCLCDCGRNKVVISGNLVQYKSTTCGFCIHELDLVGKRFGKLIVLKREELKKSKYGKTYYTWNCLCQCGKEHSVSTSYLTKGRVKSCGCHAHNEWTFLRKIYTSYKYHAKVRGYNFNLTMDQVYNLIIQNCFYCGSTPSNIKKIWKEKLSKYLYNGIDRIDNNLGYEVTNVVTCCIICNRAKSDIDLHNFMKWIQDLSYHVQNLDLIKHKETMKNEI